MRSRHAYRVFATPRGALCAYHAWHLERLRGQCIPVFCHRIIKNEAEALFNKAEYANESHI